MTEPYDLRSNIKDKPGSQGTLFQVKDKGLLNPQQRWPRGYTPERQAAVQDALKDTPIVGIGTGARDAGNPEAMRRIVPKMDREGNMRFADYPQTEARVVGALARSTVPVEDLHGLTRIHNEPQRGHAATYWPGRREIAVKIHKYDRAGEEELIHEVGHHVSHKGSIGQQTAVDLADDQSPQGLAKHHEVERIRPGVEEAVADNYALEHYRPHGRNPQPLPSETPALYERVRTPQALDKEFPGYTSVRPQMDFRNLSGAQFQGRLF